MKRLLIGLFLALSSISVVGFEPTNVGQRSIEVAALVTDMLSHAARGDMYDYNKNPEILMECYHAIDNIIEIPQSRVEFAGQLSVQGQPPMPADAVEQLAYAVRTDLEGHLFPDVRPAGPRVNMSRLAQHLKAQNNSFIAPYQIDVPAQAIHQAKQPQARVVGNQRPPLLANDNPMVKRNINVDNSWLTQLNCVDQNSEIYIRNDLFHTCPTQALRAAALAVQSFSAHDLNALTRLTNEQHAVNFIRTILRNGNGVSDLVDQEIANIMQTPVAKGLITQNVLNHIMLIDTITSFEITGADTPMQRIERIRQELATHDSYCHAFIVNSSDIGQYSAMKRQGQNGKYSGGKGPIMHWFTYVVYKHNNQVHYFIIDSLAQSDHLSGLNFERFIFFKSVLEQGFKQENLRRYQTALTADHRVKPQSILDTTPFGFEDNEPAEQNVNFWNNSRLAQAAIVPLCALGMWKLYDIFKK